ncbi:MAG: hypothetical protein A2498_07015 [Lentisphaerae bacterium RIFOXYC12_FULL_60_16]|nr:MAG: hypothetical protein A2498_07015 [Lentisphaerae bacterium RIFOXYC12_FULL_60_16]
MHDPGTGCQASQSTTPVHPLPPLPSPRSWITGLLLAFLSILVYLPTLRYDFVQYDDTHILAEHPERYNQARFTDSVRTILFKAYPREEPLLVRDLSWAVDSRWFGFPNPAGYHGGNILLHSLVVMLAFLFTLSVTHRYTYSLLIALAFIALAVHAEPVAWIMGRKDILAAGFSFMTLIAYLRFVDLPRGRRAWAWYAGSMVFTLLALLSKISAVTLPAILLLLGIFRPWLTDRLQDCEPRRDARTILRLIAGILPHVLIALTITAWYRGVLSDFGLLNRGYDATPLQHARNLLVINPLVFLRYLQLVLVPVRLRVFHTWPDLAASTHGPSLALAILVLLSLAIGLGWILARRRHLAFPCLAFFAVMVPYLNLTYIGIWVANRYLYFSAYFLVMILAAIAAHGFRSRNRIVRWATGLALLVVVGCNLHAKAVSLPVWRNAETFWMHEAAQPDAPTDAFYGLAAWCYRTANNQTDPHERNAWLDRSDAVITRAIHAADSRPAGSPKPSLHSLFLLRALIGIVREDPSEQQRAALEYAEQARPDYDAALWQLTVFWYKRAMQATNPAEREPWARTALDYCRRYLRATPRDAGYTDKVRGMRQEFMADFPFLTPELETFP